MRRNKQHVIGRFNADLDEIPAVQTQNGPPIRFQIADITQPGIQPLHRFEAGHQHHVVHLAGLVVLFVNHADLCGQHKTDRTPASLRQVFVHRGL